MLVTGFPAGGFAANCYVVAPGPGSECVIIDPGEGAEPGIEEILAAHRLQPIAVLLTHGHIDHVWSVAPVCDAKDVPAYIHPADRALLTDPELAFGQSIFGGLRLTEPDDVKELKDGEAITVGGLSFTVTHSPGHTRGSVTFLAEEHLFSGDLLFAGSIGRTDLPGGDNAQMQVSLGKAMTLPDQTLVLPGHGPTTTIGQERASNPFLAPGRGL